MLAGGSQLLQAGCGPRPHAAQPALLSRPQQGPSRRCDVRGRYAGGHATAAGQTHDVVLSSGFLAFAQHAGFLQAVEEAGVHVGGVMGTSAGALTGSLYAAGYSPREVAHVLSEQAPIQLLQPCFEPWRGGLLSLEGVIARLRELLPPTFEGLQRELAVGVVTADGRHVLIDHGPLPEAVAASAAIPFVFSNIDVPGGLAGLKDGGVVDRVGLVAWRQRRRRQQQLRRAAANARPPPCLVHVIERSSPFSGADDAEGCGEEAVQVVRCPKSGVNFFDLGDFSRQFEEARGRAACRLEGYAPPGHTHMAAAASSSSGSNVLPAGAVLAGGGGAGAGLLVAAAGSAGSASAGAAAAPAGLAAARPSASPRSSVRRAVADDA